MQNRVAFALLLLLSSSATTAQTDQPAVDQLFAAYGKAGSPGCSLGVVKDGSLPTSSPSAKWERCFTEIPQNAYRG